MSSIDRDDLLAGDMVVAVHEMRVWESDDKRGWVDMWIQQGEPVLVVQTWTVGKQRRVRVFSSRFKRFLLFSCQERRVSKNWRIVCQAPRLLPTSGGT